MLSRVELFFPSVKCTGLSYQSGSVFQGALMDSVNQEYGDELHLSVLKPYSQYVIREGGFFVWQINGLTSDAKENILNKLSALQMVELKSKGLVLPVEGVNSSELPYTELIKQCFSQNNSRYIDIQFVTPTAFKSDGQYLFYPTVKHILQSGINRFDALSTHSQLYDDEVLKQLTESVSISRYNLQSTVYHLESIKIPAFIGTISLKINGPLQLVNLVHLIIEYAQYSGIGIKTAMGMGAIKILRRGKTDE